jgi:hypothetical protein
MGVAVDPAGNVYFAGTIAGTGGITGVDSSTRTEYTLRDGLASSSLRDGLVAKFGPDGGLIWVTQFGAAGTTEPNDIAVDATGAAYIAGQSSSTFVPSLGIFPIDSYDALVAKLNADGSLAWTRTFGAAGRDVGDAVALAADGGAYVVGTFSAAVPFGGATLTSRGSWDAFVARLSPAGAFGWARQMGGTSWEEGRGVAAYQGTDPVTNLPKHYVYVAGRFASPTADIGGVSLTYTGDPSQITSSNSFVSKLEDTGTAGNVVWAAPFGPTPTATTGFVQLWDLAVDATGGVYTTGTFGEEADFDPGPGQSLLTATPVSAYVSKLDAAGNFAWARRLGLAVGSTTGGPLSKSLTWDATSGAAFLTGGYYSSALDTGSVVLPNSGADDVYVVKLAQPDQAPPLAVAGVQVDAGEAQRSAVRSLTVTFTGVASLGPGAFELARLGVGGGAVGLSVTSQVVGGRTVATLTFTSHTDPVGGSLADGDYRLAVRAAAVTDASGRPLSSDHALAFHRLYGDATGDRRVDNADFFLFRSSFGRAAGDPLYLAYLDFNGDGRVDNLDFFQLRTRFGTTLP